MGEWCYEGEWSDGERCGRGTLKLGKWRERRYGRAVTFPDGWSGEGCGGEHLDATAAAMLVKYNVRL